MCEENEYVRQEYRKARESEQTWEVECELPRDSFVVKCCGFEKKNREVDAGNR